MIISHEEWNRLKFIIFSRRTWNITFIIIIIMEDMVKGLFFLGGFVGDESGRLSCWILCILNVKFTETMRFLLHQGCHYIMLCDLTSIEIKIFFMEQWLHHCLKSITNRNFLGYGSDDNWPVTGSFVNSRQPSPIFHWTRQRLNLTGLIIIII